MPQHSLLSDLRSLTFGMSFNQPMDKTLLPNGLQTLTFGMCFDQALQATHLPTGLQKLIFGMYFNQNMEIGARINKLVRQHGTANRPPDLDIREKILSTIGQRDFTKRPSYFDIG